MMIKARYTVLAFLVAEIILVLALTLYTPQIYSAANDTFSTPFHDNVDMLKVQPQNSTTDIAPLLQDFIDYPGTVSLDIQINDVADAQRDLQSFEKSRLSLDHLIVKLNLNQSQIQDLEKDTAQQKEILESLLNSSVTLNSLQTLEIQYRDENNNDMLTTVRLQGNALRKQVQSLNERYRNSTEKVSAIATKFGLDDTKNQASQKTVDQISQDIAPPESTAKIPVNTTLTPGDERISLYLNPETGQYHDVISCMGLSLTLIGNTTLRANGQTITLYLDDVPLYYRTTDMFGYYNFTLPIGQIAAGNHTVYTRSPDTRSVNRVLTVIPVSSVTNLSVSTPDRDGNVNCTGFVIANYPVTAASVQLSLDQSHVIVTKTNAHGEFVQKVKLAAGTHSFVADFSGDGYPITPSESDPVTVEVPVTRDGGMDYGRIALIIFVLGIFLVSLGAAVRYLRRMEQRKLPSPGMPHNDAVPGGTGEMTEEKMLADNSPGPGKETLIETYRRLLAEEGLSAASRGVYQQLSGRIARDLNIKRHRALTAREISRKCRKRPYCGAFARFVLVYERIRYGGKVSEKDQAVFETALDSTQKDMGSEGH